MLQTLSAVTPNWCRQSLAELVEAEMTTQAISSDALPCTLDLYDRLQEFCVDDGLAAYQNAFGIEAGDTFSTVTARLSRTPIMRQFVETQLPLDAAKINALQDGNPSPRSTHINTLPALPALMVLWSSHVPLSPPVRSKSLTPELIIGRIGDLRWRCHVPARWRSPRPGSWVAGDELRAWAAVADIELIDGYAARSWGQWVLTDELADKLGSFAQTWHMSAWMRSIGLLRVLHTLAPLHPVLITFQSRLRVMQFVAIKESSCLTPSSLSASHHLPIGSVLFDDHHDFGFQDALAFGFGAESKYLDKMSDTQRNSVAGLMARSKDPIQVATALRLTATQRL